MLMKTNLNLISLKASNYNLSHFLIFTLIHLTVNLILSSLLLKICTFIIVHNFSYYKVFIQFLNFECVFFKFFSSFELIMIAEVEKEEKNYAEI